MKKKNLENWAQFFSTVAVILLTVSQVFNYLETSNYNRIITDFDEKNEIFFNYQRGQIDRNFHEMLSIERFLLYGNSEGMTGKINGTSPNTDNLGLQVDRLNVVRAEIRSYNSILIVYSILNVLFFVVGILFLFVSLGLYSKLISK